VVAGGPQYGRFLYFAATDMQLVVLMVKILRVAVDETSTPPPQILTVGAWMTGLHTLDSLFMTHGVSKRDRSFGHI